MRSNLAIGAAAGLVSALLFAVTATGSALSVLTYLVAPLPVLIAGMGWSHRAAAAAAGIGGAILAIGTTPLAGFVYLASVALPAWWFAYLLLLARQEGSTEEWYPLGRLLVWIAGITAGLTIAGAVFLTSDYDNYVASFERAILAIDKANPGLFAALEGEDRAQSLRDFARLMMVLAPPISAAISVLIDVLLIWAAARVCLASQRLPRPWPPVATTTMPGWVLTVLGASLAGSLVLDQFAGLAMHCIAATLMMAYALQGVAVAHVLSLGMKGRSGLLGGLYLVLLIIPGWPVLAMSMLGIADALFGFRIRRMGASPPAPHVT